VIYSWIAEKPFSEDLTGNGFLVDELASWRVYDFVTL